MKKQFETTALRSTHVQFGPNLVLQAVGRTPNGKKISADKAGVALRLRWTPGFSERILS